MGRFTDWLRGPTPVTAAATTVTDARELDSIFGGTGRNISAAWKVWREVGEIHYATTQQARLVSRVEWDLVIDGVQAERESAERALEEAFGNQLPDIAQKSALHLQVAGGYILARWPDGIRRGGPWDVVSLVPDYRVKELLLKADVLVHVTNPDPADPQLTDSPVIAALDVARDLILARGQSRAASRNRTAQHGFLFYPLEGAGQDPEGFKKKLQAVMTAPLADEGSAASVVPNLVGFPGDWIDKVKPVTVVPDYEKDLHERIESYVRQIAMILDSPPEILLGMGDVNHWSSWAIQEDNWFGHTEPLARRVGEGFAEAMAFAADMDAERMEVNPDPAPLLQRRPALADVATAYTNGVVDADYYREALGADPDDAPDAPPETEDPPAEEEPAPEDPSGEEVAPVVQLPVAAAADPPFSTQRLLDIDRAALDSTLDLADIAIQRVRERVGAQLRARAQKTDLAATIKDTPNEELPVKLGVSDLPGLDQTITDTLTSVVPKRWQSLVKRTYAQVRAAGVDITLDDLNLQDSTQTLISALALIARDALDGKPTDANTWVAAQRALTIAGGNPDPAPVAAAFGISDAMGIGIALGGKAILHIARATGLLARRFRWVYGSDPRAKPHLVHEALDGQEFDGEALIQDGIRWYPGDHAGCLCSVEPIWEAAS